MLGSFNDHNGYNGVFLGLPGMSWHFEFTTSNDVPARQTDPDDLMVFYAPDAGKLEIIRPKCILNNAAAKNPYWDNDGVVIIDPDGYIIVIALE